MLPAHRLRTLGLWAWGLIGVGLIAGCAGLGGPPAQAPASAQEQAAYSAAVAKAPTDPAAASSALKEFLNRYPKSPLADDATEQLARIALAEGRESEATARLETLIQRYPNGDRAEAAKLRLTRWAVARGDLDQARLWLSQVQPSRLDRVQRRLFYQLSAKLATDPVQRVVDLASLRANLVEAPQASADATDSTARAQSAQAVAVVDTEIDGQLETLTVEQLGRLAVVLNGKAPPAGRIRLLLARRALESGDADNAKRLVEKAGQYDLTLRDQERRAGLERRLGLTGETEGRAGLPAWTVAAAAPRVSTEEVTATIGVLLPLSGRLAPYGEEALRGILLAAQVFEAEPPKAISFEMWEASLIEEPATSVLTPEPVIPQAESISSTTEWSGPGVRLVIRDTAGDPVQAAAAVRELAQDEEILAIIGPVLSGTSDAAAHEAEIAGIPLLTLSNRVEIAQDRDFVFRLRMTPADEVGFLVDYAFDQLEARRFAVLYPRSRYGRGMRSRYWEAVEDRGGSIVATASYDPEATDYSEAIRSLAGFDLLTPREGAALEERAQAMRRGRRLEPEDAALLRTTLYEQLGPEGEPLPPIVDFDVLFIPDGHERIQLVVPQLAFHEVGPVQLLGTSEWNDAQLLRVGRRHVRGAVIATPYDEASQHKPVARFTKQYASSFGQPAQALASEAFDATQILLEQVALGRAERNTIREGILDLKAYPGVSGVILFEPDGNARKRPFLLKVQRGRFVPAE